MIETVLSKLEQRLGGRLYAKQRLGIETDHEAQIFGQGLTFWHKAETPVALGEVRFQGYRCLSRECPFLTPMRIGSQFLPRCTAQVSVSFDPRETA